MRFVLLCFCITLSRWLLAADPDPVSNPGNPADPVVESLVWLHDHAVARQQAIEQRRQLLIYFKGNRNDRWDRHFEDRILVDDEIQQLARQFVLVRVTTDDRMEVEGKSLRMLDHESFQAMNGQAGLAIVDCLHVDKPYYQQTVGCLPFEDPVYYAAPYQSKPSIRVFLDLPPGTLTQRMLVYAIRVHPDGPASTSAAAHPVLMAASRQHARHQADLAIQRVAEIFPTLRADRLAAVQDGAVTIEHDGLAKFAMP
ncbi:MAG: thioredoxin family protein, partial [Planctomycetales bacterium]